MSDAHKGDVARSFSLAVSLFSAASSVSGVEDQLMEEGEGGLEQSGVYTRRARVARRALWRMVPGASWKGDTTHTTICHERFASHVDMKENMSI